MRDPHREPLRGDNPAGKASVNYWWLLKLRWGSILGQIATILFVAFVLQISLPLAPLVTIIGIGAASNLGCSVAFRQSPRVAEWQIAVVMAIDVALLTTLLYLTGGPWNPFSFLYLVQIALAAIMLHAQWTWMLVALSFGAFGLLLLDHRPLLLPDSSVHEQGMWVALGVSAAFIVHFLLRTTGALSAREEELAEARARAARQERLGSLATMAAGAAHELATPLGTIALVAKELERALAPEGNAALVDDARLIREQVGRCRVILDQMASGAGESAGEGAEATPLGELLERAMDGIRASPPVVVDMSERAGKTVLRVPPQAVSQAIRSVITNAQDASSPHREVVVRVGRGASGVNIEVIDRGEGMTASVLERVGEPFFTTKEPGRGMGLGMFLTRAVLENLGGELSIESEAGRGTSVTLSMPVP